MLSSRTLIFLLAAAAALLPRTVSAQQLLQVERVGRPTRALSITSLRALPNDTVSISSHGAPAIRFRAARLIDVMAAAGTPIDSLRLGHAGWIVAALASDGYVAVFSAGELDPKLGPTHAWVAYERDGGAPLAADEAPFRLIVPTDLHGSRGARQVTTLRILDALPPSR